MDSLAGKNAELSDIKKTKKDGKYSGYIMVKENQ